MAGVAPSRYPPGTTPTRAEGAAAVEGGGPARPTRSAGFGTRAVGVLGELLITLGVLVGLFVVWQLWWTDVMAGRTHDQVVAELDWARPAEPARPPAGADEEPELRRDGAPVLPEQPHATTFATLAVPRWGQDYVQPISEGVTRRDVLDTLGIGRYPGTAMPGEVGNFAVSAHRVTYGRPFNRVEELRVGDPLVVQTEQAWYVYRVSGTQVVLPHQVEVIAPVPNDPAAAADLARMTLTTCHPMFSARERFVVHSELDHWVPLDEGPPPALTEGL